MQFSTRSRYAVRALVELATSYGKGPVKLKDVSASQNISLKYLEQVMSPLRLNGYVKTVKGSQGGYLLARVPAEISILEIVQCVEGSLSVVDCVDNPEVCERMHLCATRNIWVGLKEAIHRELSNISLAELAEKQSLLYKSHNYNI